MTLFSLIIILVFQNVPHCEKLVTINRTKEGSVFGSTLVSVLES
jgi:hypothetical protein